MKDYVRLGSVLFIISAVACAVLAFVNHITGPMISNNQSLAEQTARQEVLPEAVRFESVEGEVSYYIGVDEESNIVGYTFIAEKTGYSGPIQTMVGIDPEFKITQIKVISQTETPGLGAKAIESEFSDQFKGKRQEELLVQKDGGDIISITGATITSRAVTQSLAEVIKGVSEKVNAPKDVTAVEVEGGE
jgi:electron transport complex protein RnfG